KIYLDGQLASRPAAEDYAGDGALGPNQEFISSPQLTNQTTNEGRFKGLIDEVSIYNRALASNEIAAIYAAGNAGKCLTNQPVQFGIVTVQANPTNAGSVTGGGVYQLGTNVSVSATPFTNSAPYI